MHAQEIIPPCLPHDRVRRLPLVAAAWRGTTAWPRIISNSSRLFCNTSHPRKQSSGSQGCSCSTGGAADCAGRSSTASWLRRAGRQVCSMLHVRGLPEETASESGAHCRATARTLLQPDHRHGCLPRHVERPPTTRAHDHGRALAPGARHRHRRRGRRTRSRLSRRSGSRGRGRHTRCART